MTLLFLVKYSILYIEIRRELNIRHYYFFNRRADIKIFEHSDDKKMNIDTSEERIKYILNELLSSEDYVSMDELSETVFISKNTLNKYIKTIKNIVNKYDLEYITKPSSGVKSHWFRGQNQKIICGIYTVSQL